MARKMNLVDILRNSNFDPQCGLVDKLSKINQQPGLKIDFVACNSVCRGSAILGQKSTTRFTRVIYTKKILNVTRLEYLKRENY